MTNSSQYIETNESFDAVALQSAAIHDALGERCKEIQNKNGMLPTLTRDLDFLCKSTGSALPFLPFTHADERKKIWKGTQKDMYQTVSIASLYSVWIKALPRVALPDVQASMAFTSEGERRKSKIKEYN